MFPIKRCTTSSRGWTTVFRRACMHPFSLQLCQVCFWSVKYQMRKGRSQHLKYSFTMLLGEISATKKTWSRWSAAAKQFRQKRKYANAVRLANQMKAGVPGCKPEDLFVVHSINGEICFIKPTCKISLEHWKLVISKKKIPLRQQLILNERSLI